MGLTWSTLQILAELLMKEDALDLFKQKGWEVDYAIKNIYGIKSFAP